MFKYKFLIALLLTTLVSASSCFSSDQKAPYPVEEGIKAIQSQDFNGASKLFHYPKQYTESELLKDRASVAEDLRTLINSFGPITSFAPATSVPNFYECAVGGGTIPYWKDHPKSTYFIFTAEFGKAGKGFVKVLLATIDNETAIRSVAFGLPVDRPDSEALVKNAMEDLIKRNAPKTKRASPKGTASDRI